MDRPPVRAAGSGILAKLEGFNPNGIKDRAALHMVAQAKQRGELAAGAMIVESTSGTLGLGLALAGIVHGHPVTVVTCSVGTGGHSAGVARVLREFFPRLRLVGVDAIGSTIFGQLARPRLMRGLGSSIHPRNVDHAAFDEVHWVAPAEAVWAARTLAATHHASGGWSVGAVALVAGWLARTSAADTRIAAIFPDGPHRYFDTVYNDDYCAEHGLLDPPPRTEPDEVRHPGSRVVERWTRCSRVPVSGPVEPIVEAMTVAGR